MLLSNNAVGDCPDDSKSVGDTLLYLCMRPQSSSAGSSSGNSTLVNPKRVKSRTRIG